MRGAGVCGVREVCAPAGRGWWLGLRGSAVRDGLWAVMGHQVPAESLGGCEVRGTMAAVPVRSAREDMRCLGLGGLWGAEAFLWG